MRDRILLMRDVADNQIIDARGRRVTKVAGVEAYAARDGSEPVVRCLLVGPEPLARRINGQVAWLVHRFTGGRRTVRIPWSDVADVGPDVCLRVEAHETGATHAEDWVRDHVARFIPGLK
jgi:sporulation protein YlmC with PRC-barrel domain